MATIGRCSPVRRLAPRGWPAWRSARPCPASGRPSARGRSGRPRSPPAPRGRRPRASTVTPALLRAGGAINLLVDRVVLGDEHAAAAAAPSGRMTGARRGRRASPGAASARGEPQRQRERAAACRLALRLPVSPAHQPAPAAPADASGRGPVPPKRRVDGAVGLGERLEDHGRERVRRDADAGVGAPRTGSPTRSASVAVRARRDGRRRPRSVNLIALPSEVDEHLAQPARVADALPRGTSSGGIEVAARGPWRRRLHGEQAPPTSRSSSRRSKRIASSSIRPASIFEKSRMSLMIGSSASADSRIVRAYSRWSAVQRRVEQQSGHAEHAVHRRADLVAHVGEELALGPVRRLGLPPRGLQFGSRAARAARCCAAPASTRARAGRWRRWSRTRRPRSSPRWRTAADRAPAR